MEHVAPIIGRVRSSVPEEVQAQVIPIRSPRTLPDLVEQFEHDEAQFNPDAFFRMSKLRATPEGLIEVPGAGACTLTDWSQKQLSSLLGVRFDRWFENASPEERADELNRRLSRATAEVLVRTTRAVEPGVEANATLRALLSPGYTPVEDSQVARLVITAMRNVDGEMRIIRADVTDRSTSYVVAVGKPYKVGGDGEVGDIWGGVMVRNSGVGFASLLMIAHLVRLACRNGMICPLPDSELLRRRHRGLDEVKLRWQLSDRLQELPGKLRLAGVVMRDSAARHVESVEAEVRSILDRAGLPQRYVAPILVAHEEEPLAGAFGVSQAITRAAQRFSPEERLELEQAAGGYLRRLS
jgi:plasmid stability protein